MCWLAEKVPTLISGRSGKVLEVAVRNVLLMHREVWKWGLYSQTASIRQVAAWGFLLLSKHITR